MNSTVVLVVSSLGLVVLGYGIRLLQETARDWLGGQAGNIPAVPIPSFEPGKYRPLAALSRSRLKDIWGLGYDDDERLERVLRG